jgi:RND family efflux transporter MFP subunit
MRISSKAAALAVGLVAALTAAAIAQNEPKAIRTNNSTADTVVVGDAIIEWLEKSDVAALREGIIDKMELQVGDEVERDKVIGYLHREIAELTVAKAKVAADNSGPKVKAQAQKKLAMTVLARSLRLDKLQHNAVSREEIEKNEAEVAVADAMEQEATENQNLSKAELDLAKRALKEHTIVAPFTGVITERFKNPGESVRANEPVVHMGNIDTLRVIARIPIEFAYRIKKGSPVEVTPNVPGAVLPIEQKKFRGKITFVDPEVEAVKNLVRVFAEVQNNDEHDLKPGLKTDMIVYLNPADAPGTPGPPPTVGVRRGSEKR